MVTPVITFTASVVMLQATAGARTWGQGPESSQQDKKDFQLSDSGILQQKALIGCPFNQN